LEIILMGAKGKGAAHGEGREKEKKIGDGGRLGGARRRRRGAGSAQTFWFISKTVQMFIKVNMTLA
jgi:hypothetical protein